MEEEERVRKHISSKEKSQGLPLDLNLLHLPQQSSKNHEQWKPRDSPPFSASPIKNNRATKLEYSKSCEIPRRRLLDESSLKKTRARRTVSAPETLKVPNYYGERCSFERPIYEYSCTTNHESITEEHDDNLRLGLKLPAIRINYREHELNNKNNKSTAGIDFRLPVIKKQKYYRY